MIYKKIIGHALEIIGKEIREVKDLKIAQKGTGANFLNRVTIHAHQLKDTCNILCKKSGDIGNYGEAGRRTRIGMYKKMHRIIEKGESLVRVRGCLCPCYQ
ncbi:hypothetical protein BAQ49_22380 [Bacillus proteolyticus]|uniref:Uncharacterized protein n=1 Tax=Bacillus proteolyticus TaxID=2026192 RepID=A0AA44KZ71_9BACI|nr:hypothetical protein [Bacillus proteolyticus]OJE51050.1 hypothetical protein BAQ49_22380 [Bacillus proteolyticus]